MTVYYFREIYIRFEPPKYQSLGEPEVDNEAQYSMDRLQKALDIHRERGGDLSTFVINPNYEKKYFQIFTLMTMEEIENSGKGIKMEPIEL